MRITYFISFISLLFLVACGGNDDDGDNNPTPIQSNNFIQFTVDGVEYNYNNASFVQANQSVDDLILNASGEGVFSEDPIRGSITLSLPDRSLNTYTPETYPRVLALGVAIDDEGNGEDIQYGLFTQLKGDGTTETFGDFTITVTAYDAASRTIEGTFSATLYSLENINNPDAPLSDPITITNGRFVAVELDI
ncbi:MAG: hypothetical protein ACFB0B_10900 [Thermonemataceae bacterium]